MANKKISELPAASTLNTTDVLPLTQGTATNKAALSLIDGRYMPRSISALPAAGALTPTDVLALTQGATTGKAAISTLDGRYTRRASTGYAAQKIRNAGDVSVNTANSTTWMTVDPGLDLTINAVAGDRVLVTVNGQWSNQNILSFANAHIVVGGSPVASVGDGIWVGGVPNWSARPNMYWPIAGGVIYTTRPADISGGTLMLRLVASTQNPLTTRILFAAEGSFPLVFAAVNLG
jgi:hypothetical protein